MANSVTYVSYSHSLGGSQNFALRFVATFSGSYVNGTGETINFLTASNPNGLELSGFLPANGLPEGIPDFTANLAGYSVNVSAYSAGSVTLNFYSADGTELASGAYSASISGGQVTFEIRHRG